MLYYYHCNSLLSLNLQLSGAHLAKVYGIQFRKLLRYVSHITVKNWNNSLETDQSVHGHCRMAVRYYLSVLDIALKEVLVS